jgi:spore coat polysaccharide biosynthesis predicted glycosyltransferase SpsG
VRYVLRADASYSIGTGHVMRLSAIGEELAARGYQVIFIGDVSDVPWVKKRLLSLEFSNVLKEESEYISNSENDVLILDSYYLPINHSFIAPSNWRKIVVIADKLTPSYQANLTIHPGILHDFTPHATGKFVSGAKFIPLRKSIVKNVKKKIDNDELKIIVVGGGTDFFNFVNAVSEILMSLPNHFQANLFTNKSTNTQLDQRFTINPIGINFDEKCAEADLVFTTASTSSLEFLAREVAVGIGCATENQKHNFDTLINLNLAAPIGFYFENEWKMNIDSIKSLIVDKQMRNKLVFKGNELIDLKGSSRIVDQILKL